MHACLSASTDWYAGCRAVVLKVENGSLIDNEQGDLRTNELTPFNMALHPDGQTLVVGVGSAGLKVLDVVQQSGSPPSLQFTQGKGLHRACCLLSFLYCFMWDSTKHHLPHASVWLCRNSSATRCSAQLW